MAEYGALQNSFYTAGKLLLRLPATAYTSTRWFNVPSEADLSRGMLLASNHQSFLDPPLIGVPLPRPVSYLARQSLFDVPGLGWILRAVRVHPVRRGQADASALKTVLRVLRAGEPLVMFPEGTRTRTGRLGEFKAGVASIAIRCRVPVMPVAIAGAHRCWPRTQALPRPGRVAVAYGRATEPEGDDAEQFTVRIRNEVERLLEFGEDYLRRTWP